MRRATTILALLATAVVATACGGSPAPRVTTNDQVEFGVQMARMGLWDEAMFRFRQASSKEPSNYRVVNNMAVAAEALGKYEDAAELYKRALAMNPGDPGIRENHDRFLGFWQAYKRPDPPPPAASAPEDEQAVEEDDSDG